MLRGIDVSVWQGNINWALLAPHIGFVLIRSSHGDTGGKPAVDKQYAANIAGARACNIPRGTYYYPGTGDPVAEADEYVRFTGRRDGELQMLDFEGDVLHVADPVTWALKWLDRVFARTGNRPLIYMSESVVNAHDWSRVVKRDYGLNVAKWGTHQPGHGQWEFWAVWQDTDRLPMPGCPSAPDGDWFNGDLGAWAAYGKTGGTAAPTPPAPAPKPARTYEVKPGNTLWGIAVHFYSDGSKYTRIAEANHIEDPDLIHAGDVLVIP